MARNNFIDKFLDYTKHAESPTSYFEWAALTSIAAVLRDNVFIKYPHYTLYPNLYTILLSAESSNTRKSVPLNLAKKVTKSVDNTRIIAGSSTMPSIIQDLGEPFITKGRVTIEGASAFIIASELTSFIKKDFDAIEQLTDLYDFHEEWSSRTKSSGSDYLKRVCLSMLVGTNEALITDLYDEKAKDGGLLARSCIIYEKRRRHMNSLEYDLLPPKTQFEDLVKDLRHIATLKGEIKRSTDSRKVFDEWYTKSLNDDNLSKSGAEGRIHDTVRKVAMILAVSELPDKKNLTIEGHHMEKAIDYGTYLLKNQREFALGAGRSQNAIAMRLVLKLLLKTKEHKLPKRKILQFLLGDVDKEVLDKVIEHGVEANVFKFWNASNESWLQLTEDLLKLYKDGRT